MKKILLYVLSMIFLSFLFIPLNLSAEPIEITDERTGITYINIPNVIVSSSSSAKIEAGRSYSGGYNLENFNLPFDSPEVTKTIEKMEADILKQFKSPGLEGDLGIDDRYLMDGYEYKAIYDTEKVYWRFFELPKGFRGTTVIVKDDVPFTVTVDDEGFLSFKIVTDYVGEKKAEFYIPSVRTHKKTERFSSEYLLTYKVKGSETPSVPGGYHDFKRMNSLEEALDYCVNNADIINSNEPIKIHSNIEYYFHYEMNVSYAYKLIVTYGNSKTAQNSSKENTVQNNDMAVNSTVSNVETESEITLNEPDNSNISSTTNSDNKSDNNKLPKKKDYTIWWIAIGSSLFLLTSVTLVIFIKFKRKRKI